MRQAFDLLGHPLGRQRLESLDQARVQPPPPLLEQTPIGHFVGEGVLEGVFVVGKQAGLIQELGRLEVREAAVQGVLGKLGDDLQQGQGHLSADDRRGLQQALLLGWQPVDAGGQHRLHRGRHLDGRECLRQAIGPPLAHQHVGLYQGPHALFQEEGVALGTLDQEPLEGV